MIRQLLILAPIMIGPLILGSYYGEFRWPLIYATWLAIFVSFLVPPGKSEPTSPRAQWLLGIATFAIIGHGCWMYFNCWGAFIENDIVAGRHYFWHIEPLASQPFPRLAGTPDKLQALDRLSSIIPSLLYGFCLCRLIRRGSIETRQLAAAIFWTGVAVASLGVLQRVSGATLAFWLDESIISSHGSVFFGTFRSPGIASAYLNLCLAIGLSHVLAMVLKNQRHQQSTSALRLLAYLSGLSLLVLGGWTAGSKAGSVFCIATLGLWSLANARTLLALLRDSGAKKSASSLESKIIAFGLALALVLGGLMLSAPMYKSWTFAKKVGFTTLDRRSEANRVQLSMLSESRPQIPDWGALGHGPGSFYPLFPFFIEDQEIHGSWFYAHNDHLQTLVEWGWLGYGGFVLIIGGAIIIPIREARHRRLRRSRRIYLMGFAVGLFICLLHATVDFPFQIESIALTAAAIIGASWAGKSLRSS